MANKLIQLIGRVGTYKNLIIGVLETPCYPCSYYGHFIEQNETTREWDTTDNATYLYKRTKQEAVDTAKALYIRMEKQDVH